ncbi:hypothetical protein CROQUDRAFT_67319 [Cronartium quercuum f. sp. fusiforme G11]|uniref:FCP1 homology domain-containing protein n=1 Tax=Cronartium quercuum f. sp. fusiforme G11 TaxID=708437 RepID=A0A9P6N997_9BASI|nr:hypothetical protein CROQUDRAFT_67319 [Cronartium quercuum f. sp. fusiforme G11]
MADTELSTDAPAQLTLNPSTQLEPSEIAPLDHAPAPALETATQPTELSADAIASLITQVPQAGPAAFGGRAPKQSRAGTVKKKKRKEESSRANTETITEDVQSVSQADDTLSADDTTQPTQTLVEAAEPAVEQTTKPTKAVEPGPLPPLTIGPQPAPPTTPTSKPVSGSRETKTIPKKANGRGVAKKTKRRKKLIELLLPCFVSTAHEDEPLVARPVSKPEPETFLSAPTEPPKRTPTETARQLRNKIKRTARRTGSDGVQPIPVSDTVTPAGAAAATSAANAGGGGVQLPLDETEGVLSGAVVPPGTEGTLPKKSASSNRLMARAQSQASLGAKPAPVERAETDEEELEDSEEEEEELEDSEDEEEDRIVAMGGMGIPVGEDGIARPLLAELDPTMKGRKCLVLDLDETLVHSSFKMIPQSDFVVPVEIENAVHNVYVIKRPGVDQFMKKMGEIYEVVVFTASLSKYADPVLDMLDIHHVVKHRLFRESCYNHKGNYVKDLSQLGRPIGETIIIDNSPASYIFHPSNAVPVSSWFNDPHDTELADLAAFLTDLAAVPDVRTVLDPGL